MWVQVIDFLTKLVHFIFYHAIQTVKNIYFLFLSLLFLSNQTKGKTFDCSATMAIVEENLFRLFEFSNLMYFPNSSSLDVSGLFYHS